MYLMKATIVEGNDCGIDPNIKDESLVGNTIEELKLFAINVLCENYYTYISSWTIYELNNSQPILVSDLESVENSYDNSLHERKCDICGKVFKLWELSEKVVEGKVEMLCSNCGENN